MESGGCCLCEKDSLKCALGCCCSGAFFKYFSLFSRSIYLKDHQGTNPHVHFMLYHLLLSHKQDFKQNRVIYTMPRHVNRCSGQRLDPKSTTDLLHASLHQLLPQAGA